MCREFFKIKDSVIWKEKKKKINNAIIKIVNYIIWILICGGMGQLLLK